MTEKDENLLDGFIKGEAPKVSMPPGMREELAARVKALADNDPVCPVCKCRMVLRIAQKGPKAGSKFWGCTNYPKCRVTIAFEADKI